MKPGTWNKSMKANIKKTSDNKKCWRYKTKDEIVNCMVSDCSEITPTDYKEYLNRVAAMLYCNLYKKLLPNNHKFMGAQARQAHAEL